MQNDDKRAAVAAVSSIPQVNSPPAPPPQRARSTASTLSPPCRSPPNASRQGRLCSHAQALHIPTSLNAIACPLPTAPIGLRSQEMTQSSSSTCPLALLILDAARHSLLASARCLSHLSSAPATGALRARISGPNLAPPLCVCSPVVRFQSRGGQWHRSALSIPSIAACVFDSCAYSCSACVLLMVQL